MGLLRKKQKETDHNFVPRTIFTDRRKQDVTNSSSTDNHRSGKKGWVRVQTEMGLMRARQACLNTQMRVVRTWSGVCRGPIGVQRHELRATPYDFSIEALSKLVGLYEKRSIKTIISGTQQLGVVSAFTLRLLIPCWNSINSTAHIHNP